MKKATVFAAALALVLSLAACGNRDNNGGQTNNGQTNNGQTNNGTTENGSMGNSGVGNNGGTQSGGVTGNANGSLTDPVTGTGTGVNNGTGTGTVTNNGTGTGAVTNNGTGTDAGTQSRSRVGNDLRRAADGVGDAVTDLVDDGRNAVSRAASATTFERMLDNARVHDTDGVLTDGENSRW